MKEDFDIIDPQQSLRIIRDTIDIAKKNVRENGFYFLLWGVLVVGASVIQWYLQHIAKSENHGIAWLLMTAIGVPAVIIYGWMRRRDNHTPSNLVNKWYGMIWAAFGISMIIVLPMAIVSRVSPVPFVLVLAGFATFLSGVLLQFLPLRLGGAALWAGAFLCFWVKPGDHNLVQAIFIILGYIVPGIYLNRQFYKANAQ